MYTWFKERRSMIIIITFTMILFENLVFIIYIYI